MRGSSGAKFTFTDAVVTKFADGPTGARVRDQGIWLQQYDDSIVLPAVFTVHHNSYDMEKLTTFEELTGDVPVDWPDVFNTCNDVIEMLHTELWHKNFDDVVVRYVRYNQDGTSWEDDYRDHHSRYVRGLLGDVGLRREYRTTLRRFAGIIKWGHLRLALTHGDCIIDNVLWRVSSLHNRTELVLIDPIPACPALPDVEALDVGRVLQSAAGYEHVRYMTSSEVFLLNQTPLTERLESILNTWRHTFDLNEARAALYFSIIHMLRGVRTAQRVAPDKVHGLKTLTRLLMEETEKWMR